MEPSKIHQERRTKKTVLLWNLNQEGAIQRGMNGEANRTKNGHHLLAAGALALAGCLWGTGFLFGKIAMAEMTVAENVTFRFIAGAVALSPILLRARRYRGRELRLLLFASVIGVPVQFLIQFKGLQLTTVSHASLIVGVLPVSAGP